MFSWKLWIRIDIELRVLLETVDKDRYRTTWQLWIRIAMKLHVLLATAIKNQHRIISAGNCGSSQYGTSNVLLATPCQG